MRGYLLRLSDLVAGCEELEVRIQRLPDNVRDTQEGREVQEDLRQLRDQVHEQVAVFVRRLEKPGRPPR